MTNSRQGRELEGDITWRTSYWFVVLLALVIGVLVIAASLGIDWAIHGAPRSIFASDCAEGVAATVLSGIALLRLQKRRRELMIRMQIVEDVNHHVRNALTSIVLSTSLQDDAELNARVRDACDRVDWVLSDVLSQSVDATTLRAEHPTWSAGRQLGKTNPRGQSADAKNMRN